MFTKMLVCSDGSPGAVNAARVGAVLAQRLGCAVALISVLDTGLLGQEDGSVSSLTIAGTSMEGIVSSRQQAAQSGVLPLFAAVGITAQSLSERGHPVAAIVEAARREGCDLIVVGSRGQGGSASFLFGSVAEGVLRHAACSVLVVPDAPATSNTPAKPAFGHLLLASDASSGANAATKLAAELAAKLPASLTVVNVYEEPGLLAATADAFSEYYPQEHEQRVIQALRQQVADVSTMSGTACTLRQEKGHPVESILRVAQEERAGLIVVGHRGQGGFEALMLGSVSGRVAQNAACPTLVAR